VFSDCGANFVGVDNVLQEPFTLLNSNKVVLTTTAAKEGISWRFNPPGAYLQALNPAHFLIWDYI